MGKKCGRCSTRYCGPACQKKHWEEGGHDQLCRKIKKAGGAEQFHANTKYAEAVGVAVEACRGRHEGQKCYICLEAVHARTGEGLVRGCACGDRDGVSSPELGVVHVSCLARQAKELKLNDACRLLRCVYSGHLKLQGEEHPKTLLAANNYATALRDLGRFEDAKSVMRNMMPVAQRVLGGGDEVTLTMRVNYAQMVCNDANSTLKDLNMALDTLEEIEPTVRRVFGISHPFTAIVEQTLQYSRAGLRACAILRLEKNLTPADIEKLEKLDLKQEEES